MTVRCRNDSVIDKEDMVEIKSVEVIKPVITYLHLTGYKIGLLINFNEELTKVGTTRWINNNIR